MLFAKKGSTETPLPESTVRARAARKKIVLLCAGVYLTGVAINVGVELLKSND
jgi:hypothetical protein